MFEETSVITEIILLPLENGAQVKWRNTVTKDGEIISVKDHYKIFGPDARDEFLAKIQESAPDWNAAVQQAEQLMQAAHATAMANARQRMAELERMRSELKALKA